MQHVEPLHRRLISSPLLWGGVASIGVYRLLRAPELQSDLVDRYLDGHPISRMMVFLFFVGAASLAGRFLAVKRQRALASALEIPEEAADARDVLEAVAAAPAALRNSLLGRRLTNAAQFVVRHGDSEGLEEELRNLADEDAARGQAAYALPKIVIWATPILGFLGTVIGITMAIAQLSPQALEESLSTVTAGLAVAFDTTALALGFSMVLMFFQFFVERLQRATLEQIDHATTTLLLSRIKPAQIQDDGAAQVKQLLETFERLVKNQAEEWARAVGQERDHWRRATETAVENARSTLLQQAEELHAARWEDFTTRQERLLTAEQEGWSRLRNAFAAHAERLDQHGRRLDAHTESVMGLVSTIDEIGSLEAALNRNLKALAGAKNFEETVLLLSSAVRMLSSQTGSGPAANAEKAA